MAWITSNLVNQLREKMYLRVLCVARDFYSKHSLGQVVNSLMYEANQVVDMLRNVMTSIVRDILTGNGSACIFVMAELASDNGDDGSDSYGFSSDETGRKTVEKIERGLQGR